MQLGRGGTGGSTAPTVARTARPSGMKPSSGSTLRSRRTTSGRVGPSSGFLSFANYTDDTSGLKLGPTVVLVISLVFIACVVLLHIWGKFHR